MNRPSTLGASETPAVAGVDPYRNAADVYLLKTGQVAEFAGNAATERGTALEPYLLDLSERRLGLQLKRQVQLVHPSGLLHATIDGLAPLELLADDQEPFIVEAKTSGNPDGWGEEGTDQVPDRVLVQVAQQFACAGPAYRFAYVPVVLPGFKSLDIRVYRIRRNDALVAEVEAIGIAFMEAVARRELPTVLPSLETLNRITRAPMKRVTVHEDLVARYQEANAARLAAQEVEDEAKRALLSAIGDAELADFGDPEREVAFPWIATATFAKELLKTEHPDLYAQYVGQGGYRKLSIRKRKKPKKETAHV